MCSAPPPPFFVWPSHSAEDAAPTALIVRTDACRYDSSGDGELGFEEFKEGFRPLIEFQIAELRVRAGEVKHAKEREQFEREKSRRDVDRVTTSDRLSNLIDDSMDKVGQKLIDSSGVVSGTAMQLGKTAMKSVDMTAGLVGNTAKKVGTSAVGGVMKVGTGAVGGALGALGLRQAASDTVFGALDKDGDGAISARELQSIDRDGDGIITASELQQVTVDEGAGSQDSNLRQAASDAVFGALDKDGDGAISARELASIDRDGDGVITASELRQVTVGEGAQVEEPTLVQPGTPQLPPLRQAGLMTGGAATPFSAQIAASWLAKRQVEKQNQQRQAEEAGGIQRIGVKR
eukprot:COSAG02_NODE_7423_length_3023_cov_2.153215_2_plen_348_part_00